MTRQISMTTKVNTQNQSTSSTKLSALAQLVAMGTLLWAFMLSLGCTMSSTEDDNIFALPLAIEQDEDGVYVSRLENPVIRGWTVGDDLHFLDRDPEPDESRKQIYFSDYGEAVVVYSDRNVFSDSSTMGYVGIDPNMQSLSMEGIPGRTLKFFELPSVSLPDNYETTTFELSRRWGQGHITPHPVLETIQMRLADDVIVMPVHVHNFVSSTGESANPQITQRMIRDWIDPGGVVNDGVGARLDAIEDRTHAQVRQGQLKPSRYKYPDQIFEKAGIQFHLASYEEIPQNLGLESRNESQGLQNISESALAFGGGICSSAGGVRIHSFVDEDMEEPGIHIYLGGRIAPRDLLADVNAITCKPQYTNLCWSSFSGRKFIALDVSFRLPAENVVAHELGHFLGLDHTYDPSTCGEGLGPFDDPESDNLMVAGTGRNLTGDQAERAREMACGWMNYWELPLPLACQEDENEEGSNGLPPLEEPIDPGPFGNEPIGGNSGPGWR